MREVLVTPITERDERNLRYAEWEYSRRRKVEADSQNHIGYVHLRAMTSDDIAEWARDFYPVFDRQGLIIDVRHNNGGNIDSWILAKLLRRAWFYWQPRIGNPTWNMQYAFRGHIVVLCDQGTASDGEAFSEGIRRLDLGKIIGMRTWGGEASGSPSATSSLTRVSPQPPKSASTARMANGSSKATASTPTSSWTIFRTPRSPAATPNSTPPSSIYRTRFGRTRARSRRLLPTRSKRLNMINSATVAHPFEG